MDRRILETNESKKIQPIVPAELKKKIKKKIFDFIAALLLKWKHWTNQNKSIKIAEFYVS